VIRGLKSTTFENFIGKNTNDNLADMDPSWLLNAKNCICMGDGGIRKMPGYTLVKQLSSGKVSRIYDFQRDSDAKQFVIVQRGTNLGWIKADGSTSETSLSTGEDPNKTFEFVKNYFAAYAANGTNNYKLVDIAGTLTKRNWGIAAPTVAPGISVSGGSLTLTKGRQYVYCFVSYWTDASGVQRMHIGPPSPISAHSGPQTSKVVTLTGLQVSSDAQVTHKWIFETVDTPANTSSVYYFAAEITNATTSWGDTLADSALDTTRLVPWDNKPAPAGIDILVTYQNRVVGINSSTGYVYASGYEEIDLGIPEESWPSNLFFQIPSGVRKPTGATVVNQGDLLLIGTEEGWYPITGYSADTFTMKDRLFTPGPAGKKAIVNTPYGTAYLAKDKRVRLMPSAGGQAIEITGEIGQPLQGTYAADDLKDSELGNAEVKWLSFGKNHFLTVLANTSEMQSSGFNWAATWYVNIDKGEIKSVGLGDFLPTDVLGTAGNVLVGSTPYLFLGDFSTGAIYRWPDGYKHSAATVRPVARTAWSKCGVEGKSRFFWADLYTDRTDAKEVFGLAAVSSDGPNMLITPAALELQPLQTTSDVDTQCARAGMNVQGAGIGKYCSIVILFPEDDQPAMVQKLVIHSQPLFGAAP
jgi:hypothetical protein